MPSAFSQPIYPNPPSNVTDIFSTGENKVFHFSFCEGNLKNCKLKMSLLRWPKSVTAISILLKTISIFSRQFQYLQGNFNFTHDNFNFFTAISIYSRQFQFAHGNFNYFTHGNFNLLSTISIYSTISFFQRQITLTAFLNFASLTTSKRKIKSRYLKSIFKVKSENQKSKIDSRTPREDKGDSEGIPHTHPIP